MASCSPASASASSPSSRSRLAGFYSGETGFDIYTRAVSDVYQDLFGEGIFTGKGIYEVDVIREVLEHRFPENALLSHDLIEGAYARVGLVTDIELIDDYPSHFSAYSRRKHRWVRGDWQILRWLFRRVPDHDRRLVPNPISPFPAGRSWTICAAACIEPALLVLLLGGWFLLPGSRLPGPCRGRHALLPGLLRSVVRPAARALAKPPRLSRLGPRHRRASSCAATPSLRSP